MSKTTKRKGKKKPVKLKQLWCLFNRCGVRVCVSGSRNAAMATATHFEATGSFPPYSIVKFVESR